MPKTVKKSAEFGRWVKSARRESGKRQHELATAALLKQPYWSKIERQGVVPTDEELSRICEVLRKPEQEARAILKAVGDTNELERRLEADFMAFRDWLISLPEPVHIYIVREDPEPVDEDSIWLHYEILSAAPHLKISILFRYSDRKTWVSFRQLFKGISEAWKEAKQDGTLASRLFGYYRSPDANSEEAAKWAMPMPQPAVVVVDSTGPYLFTYGLHPYLYLNQRRATVDDYRAPHKNIVLSTTLRYKARLLLNWIEPDGLAGKPTSELWKPISREEGSEQQNLVAPED
jgi:transcriptional regulator with XRE-family HTH domain